MKLSGPQKKVRMPVSRLFGTRLIAASTYGPMRSQSGWIEVKEESGGIAPTFHGAHRDSNRPIIKPPTSSR